MEYRFYYDESEHSRVINFQPLLARHITMAFWQLSSVGAAIMKLPLKSVIMILKKNTPTVREKES